MCKMTIAGNVDVSGNCIIGLSADGGLSAVSHVQVDFPHSNHFEYANHGARSLFSALSQTNEHKAYPRMNSQQLLPLPEVFL